MILLSILFMFRQLECMAPPSQRCVKKTFRSSFYPFFSATFYTILVKQKLMTRNPLCLPDRQFLNFFLLIFKQGTWQILTVQLSGFVLLHCGYMQDLLQWFCKSLLLQTMFSFFPFLPGKSIESGQFNTLLGITDIQKHKYGLLSFF